VARAYPSPGGAATLAFVAQDNPQILLLYFAALRELVGRDEERLELPPEVKTVRDFVAYIALARPVLAGKLASVRVAVNEAFAQDSDDLSDARVIALIPPVAGG